MNRQVVVTDSAFLWREDGGEILLCIGALAYTPTDWLPQAMLLEHRLPVGIDAAAFVQELFTRKLGEDRTVWPDLAVRFVAAL